MAVGHTRAVRGRALLAHLDEELWAKVVGAHTVEAGAGVVRLGHLTHHVEELGVGGAADDHLDLVAAAGQVVAVVVVRLGVVGGGGVTEEMQVVEEEEVEEATAWAKGEATGRSPARSRCPPTSR